MDVASGQRVVVLDAFGEPREKRVVVGGDTTFLACDEAEWVASKREGRAPEADPFPWPAADIREINVAHA